MQLAVEVPAASPKQQGTTIEDELVDGIDELESVGDATADWHDARITTLLEPSSTLPFVGVCLLEADTPVEIKSAQVWISRGYNAGRQRGRFYIKRRAHEKLREARGAYVFAVYEPGTEDAIRALLVVPAAVLDDVLEERWSTVDHDRSEQSVAKVTWTHVIDPPRVEERDE
jgi:hypothetical protein